MQVVQDVRKNTICGDLNRQTNVNISFGGGGRKSCLFCWGQQWSEC